MRAVAIAVIAAAIASPAALAANSAAASKPSPLAGMTRDAYIHRQEQRAAAHFDRMDANHDGVLQQSEIDAWRAAHRRHRRGATTKPASQ